MFDQLRASVRSVFEAARSPADRRSAVAGMKEALVHARLGIEELRRAIGEGESRLAQARAELETTQRRRVLAANIGDDETVAVAQRFERTQAERVAVLEAKLAAQQRELELAERESAEMAAEFRRLAIGVPGGSAAEGPSGGPSGPGLDADLGLGSAGRDAGLSAEIDALRTTRERAAREAEVDDRLAALKRRMGK